MAELTSESKGRARNSSSGRIIEMVVRGVVIIFECGATMADPWSRQATTMEAIEMGRWGWREDGA